MVSLYGFCEVIDDGNFLIDEMPRLEYNMTFGKMMSALMALRLNLANA